MTSNSTSTSGSTRHFVVKAATRVTASGNPISLSDDDDDQPILMEAKLREMITSINQLIFSNQQLDEALLEAHDDDLLDALTENETLIHRKIYEATKLAAKLNKHGIHVSLADKVSRYDGSSVLKKMEEETNQAEEKNGGGDDDDNGIYL